MRISKIDQVKAYIWKNDQLLFLYIAVDRFLKRTLSLDWFLNYALSPDRFFWLEGLKRSKIQPLKPQGRTGKRVLSRIKRECLTRAHASWNQVKHWGNETVDQHQRPSWLHDARTSQLLVPLLFALCSLMALRNQHQNKPKSWSLQVGQSFRGSQMTSRVRASERAEPVRSTSGNISKRTNVVMRRNASDK